MAAVWADLWIGVIEPDESPRGRAVQLEVLGIPQGQNELITAFAHAAGVAAYRAWDGDKVVATGDVGECVSGTTLPAYAGVWCAVGDPGSSGRGRVRGGLPLGRLRDWQAWTR